MGKPRYVSGNGNLGKAIVTVIVIVAALAAVVTGFFLFRGKIDGLSGKLSRAERLVNEQKYEKAIGLYDKILDKDPKNVEAYGGKFDAYLKSGDVTGAVQTAYDMDRLIYTEKRYVTKKLLCEEAERMKKEITSLSGDDLKEAEAKIEELKDAEAEAHINETRGVNSPVSAAAASNDTRTYKGSLLIESSDYDSSGRLSKHTVYNRAGDVRYYEVYEYNEAGQNDKAICYKPDGSVYEWRANTFDENGKCVLSTLYDAEDAGKGIEVYEYDAEGNKVKITNCYSDGSLKSIDEYDATARNLSLPTIMQTELQGITGSMNIRLTDICQLRVCITVTVNMTDILHTQQMMREMSRLKKIGAPMYIPQKHLRTMKMASR